MPPRAPGSSNLETLVLAGTLLGLAGFFGVRQWLEVRARPPDLDDADRTYHRGKDIRRFLGSALMTVMAALMIAATRINPRASLALGRLWGWLWIAILALVVVMLAIAFLDWRANTRYAVRHRRALLAEQRDFFASLKRGSAPRQTSNGSNGHLQGPPPSQPSTH